MKIVLSTTFTPYNNDVDIQPSAPLWALYNSGINTVTVNEVFPIPYGNYWGFDTTPLYRKQISHYIKTGKLIKIKHDFVARVRSSKLNISIIPNVPLDRLIVLETNFKISK